MIKKIISGGQTGADQAAIDLAIKLGIPYGGWLPKGRKTEKGPLPEKYLLQELPERSYSKRTQKNVIDSDGTLIVSHGELTGGSELTRITAKQNDRPCLHIDLNKTIAFKAAEQIRNWIETNKIEVLNVAGPRESNDPKIYKAVGDILETVLHLDIIDTSMPDLFSAVNNHSTSTSNLPRTVDRAVNVLLSELSFKDKTRLANMSENKLPDLRMSLGKNIRETFRLGEENKDLLKSCRFLAESGRFSEEDAPLIIIKELWKKLKKKTNVLRIVK
ncbi:MAG: hypothetical protein HKO79_05910 [Desulfobacterales bacterium]|nr:putative molybdenum carrier protein [Deltaproteobacteria bacterium]NNL42010.1 hypothetical protein [Desulfobacterales bacterium]